MLERLELRRLLSAAVANGILTVSGTDADDVIQLRLRASDNKVEVSVNGQAPAFDPGGFQHINVFGLAGNDRIFIQEAVASVDAPPPDHVFRTPVSMNRRL